MPVVRTRAAQALALLGLTCWPRGLVDVAAAEEFVYLGAGPLLGDRARQLRATSAPPADWVRPAWDDSAWGEPEAAPPPPPDGGIPDGGAPACSGALYLRRRFDVGPELQRLAGLTLRLRYEDGFAAYVNGVEVARRRLPAAALTDATTLATERRPVEIESYYVQAAGLLRARDNLLAIEVHPRLAGACPQVTAELGAADGPRAVRGPYIERLDESSVDLAIESDVPTALQVRYGKGPAAGDADRQVRDPGPATVHRVRLTGLRPGLSYHYQMALQLQGKSATDLPAAAFHTPPRAGRPLRFVVYGDSRSGHGTHAQVVQSILAEDPDLILSTGDVVARGTEEGEWDRFFSVAAPLLRQVPVYLTPGNHEYLHRGLGARRLFELFSTMFPPQEIIGEGGEGETGTKMGALPAQAAPRSLLAAPAPAPKPSLVSEAERGYYSFDTAGVHFVNLDSNQYRSVRQRLWLEADLEQARARRARAIFVWTHAGPFSAGLHGDNADAVRDYVPILERHGVTLVFSGHDHDYERGRRRGLSYVVTGGAGAELRALRCGVPDKPACAHPPAAFLNEHHYVSAEVLPGSLVICPKRIDGTPLEPCLRSALPARR